MNLHITCLPRLCQKTVSNFCCCLSDLITNKRDLGDEKTINMLQSENFLKKWTYKTQECVQNQRSLVFTNLYIHVEDALEESNIILQNQRNMIFISELMRCWSILHILYFAVWWNPDRRDSEYYVTGTGEHTKHLVDIFLRYN